VTTFAGKANTTGDVDGVGTAARFNGPTGLTVDGDSVVYVADTNNNTIRKISSVDVKTYAADGVTITSTIPAGTVTTIAGTPGISGAYDGTANFALFSNPTGISAPRTTFSTIYVADTGNNLIRLISPGNEVSTVAGIPGISGYRDGTNTTALFNQPKSVSARGSVYVADTGNSSIRVIFGSPAAVTGISLKAPATATTTGSTGTTTTTSSGGGALDCWFAAGILLLLAKSGRGRLRAN